MKKVAVVFSGVKPLECVHWSDIKSKNYEVKDYTITHWKKNVIENNNADVFVHSWSLDYKDTILQNYNPKKYIFEKQKRFKKQINDTFLNAPSMYRLSNEEVIRSKYYSMCKSIDLLNEYEKENNFKYDVILIARMDLVWFNKINLSEIDSNYFYTSNWNYAFDKNKGRNLMCNGKALPLDHFFIANSNDIKIFGKLYDEIDNFIKYANPHKIILEFICKNKLWDKHKNIYHTFYDHLLLRALFNNCDNVTDEWRNYDSKKQRGKLLNS